MDDPSIEDSYRFQVNIDNEPALLDVFDSFGMNLYLY